MSRAARYLPPSAKGRVFSRNVRRPQATQAEPAEPLRARDKSGKYKGDDPSTPDVNEAYVGGEAPPKPTWHPRMNKAELLSVAEEEGVGGLSMENTKAEIVKALRKAGA